MLQPWDRQPAVHMNDAAGGIGKIAPDEGTHRATDVIWLSPAAFGHQTFSDPAVVDLLDRGGHIGGNHAGPNVVNGDAMRRESNGEETGRHREPRFTDAVLTAIGGDHLGGDRCDKYNRGAKICMGSRLVEHVARD